MDNKNLFKNVYAYCEAHSTPPSEVLYQLERETYLKALSPQMISGRVQGKFLSFLSQMIKPKRILEVGTFTGYAAICLAQGLTKDGILHSIEINPELAYIIKKYIKEARLNEKIQLHIGDAKDIIPALNTTFDLVFIDAAKLENSDYFNLVINKVNPGGILLVDNVLWSGKVVHQENDKHTRVIDAFNKMIQNDERVENVLLPIRDGLMMIRKK